ncbi:hypothetical protein SLS60_002353 [Paraconiothyrium brasiliense]|uniref:F-box domain-containing protein n=1 Tax=Paraconiothyrium brasiliense TaxID=300254 RepID=A0ABR3S2G3_9PLEO
MLPVFRTSQRSWSDRAAADLQEAQEKLDESSESITKMQWAYRDVHLDEATEKELDKLQEQHKAICDDTTTKTSKFITATVSHSQAICRGLSEEAVHRLPREIRDIIYGYLCDRKRRISVRPTDNKEFYRVVKSPYNDRIETPIPRLFSTKYLHTDFLFELVSFLYQTATFHIWDCEDISNFLLFDIFRVGCIPKDHVRKLSLVIFTDEYGEHCGSKREIREKLEQLEQLHTLKHRQGFRLDLHLCIGYTRQRPTVARFCQLLLPHLHNLKNAGFVMRFPLKKYHYPGNGNSNYSMMNQLQSSNSEDPRDWVVDDEELEAWKDSKYVQNAFKKSARYNQRFLSDSDSEDFSDSPVPAGFEDGDVDSDENDENNYLVGEDEGIATD